MFAAKAYFTIRASNVNGLRHVVVRTLTTKGDFEYTMLISNIPESKMSANELYHFYNGRQTTEAFFKTCKKSTHIKNIRTTRFNVIHAFLWIVFIAQKVELVLPEISSLARKFVECMQPWYEQILMFSTS